MNTKYRYKPLAIDAIQFSATPQGIAAIAVFGGGDFTGVNLSGNPLPAAFVNGLVVPEGSWLIRNASGMYKVLKDSVFTAVCEREPITAIIEAAQEACPEIEEPVAEEAAKVVSRDQAIALGLQRFFTGDTCIHGHTDERYTINGRCVTCQKESGEKSAKRLKKLKAQREYSARYYQKRKEAMGAAGSLAQNMGA